MAPLRAAATKMASRPAARGTSIFRPLKYVSGVCAIDLEGLRAAGVAALLIDIDNTVMPHHSPEVIPEIREWLDTLSAAGFKVCLVSNNWHGDLGERAASLGLPVIGKAGKPLPFGFRRAASHLGVPISDCAVIGDQIFTDILGGNLAGARCVLVQPLGRNDLPHTRVLRRLEQFIMGRRAPES